MVACLKKGASPIPTEVKYPFASVIICATGSTCVQNLFNLLNLMVALVNTATAPV